MTLGRRNSGAGGTGGSRSRTGRRRDGRTGPNLRWRPGHGRRRGRQGLPGTRQNLAWARGRAGNGTSRRRRGTSRTGRNGRGQRNGGRTSFGGPGRSDLWSLCFCRSSFGLFGFCRRSFRGLRLDRPGFDRSGIDRLQFYRPGSGSRFSMLRFERDRARFKRRADRGRETCGGAVAERRLNRHRPAHKWWAQRQGAGPKLFLIFFLCSLCRRGLACFRRGAGFDGSGTTGRHRNFANGRTLRRRST